jgi:hypothetical protein
MTFTSSPSQSSFGATSQTPQKIIIITLLVGTNEENYLYLQELQNMIDALSLSTTIDGQKYQLKLQMIDMESFIWNYITTEVKNGVIPKSYLNNLHAFEILEYIMNNRVDFKLVQRRFRYCNPCDKIVLSGEIKRQNTVVR